MPYSPKSVANYFLELAKSNGQPITPMKLQKLVYYAHGWYAGYTGQPLIDEPVEAWQYGPVIPSLYHEFKRFGAGPINNKATSFDGIEFGEVLPPADPNVRTFLDNIWNSYAPFPSMRLSEMTHAPNGPWDRVWSAAGGIRGTDIPFETIHSHFKAAVENATHQGVLA